MLMVMRIHACHRRISRGSILIKNALDLPGYTSVPHPSVSSPLLMAYVFKMPVNLTSGWIVPSCYILLVSFTSSVTCGDSYVEDPLEV